MYYPNRVDLDRNIIILRGRGISYNLEYIHLIDPALLYCWIIFYSLRGRAFVFRAHSGLI
jgi:hypothetical protein